MSCIDANPFQTLELPLTLVSGVALDEHVLVFDYADGDGAAVDLSGFSGTWSFRESPNGRECLLLTTADGSLLFNSGGVTGQIWPQATAAQISAMTPKNNRGVFRLTILDADGNTHGGAEGVFKWEAWG